MSLRSDRDNPFATRHTRPGALAYDFGEGASLDDVLERLEACGGWGSIVGPHGSGKSTLVATLASALERAGRGVLATVLHAGQRRLPAGFAGAVRDRSGPATVIVDGYEQLGWWARWRLERLCRRGRHGLVVTCHRPVALPVVFATKTSPELAQRLAARLMPPTEESIAEAVVGEIFRRHAGNLREVLMDLYDVFEQRDGPHDA